MKRILLLIVLLTTLFVNNVAMTCEDCDKADPKVELRGAMQKLWNDHIQWTFATIDAYFHNPKGIDSQLIRLLQNQN